MENDGPIFLDQIESSNQVDPENHQSKVRRTGRAVIDFLYLCKYFVRTPEGERYK